MPFPFHEQALADGAGFVPVPPESPFYFYCIGRAQAAAAAPLLERAPAAVPVFVGESPELLMEARDRIRGAEPMGYVSDIFRNNWEESLPTAPLAVFLTCILSRRSDREKIGVLKKIHERLKPGGVVLWSDLFLPGSLELFESFQLLEARILGLPEERALRQITELHRNRYPAPCLLDRGRDLLGECGFCDITVVWKRFGYALLVAVK